LFKTVIRNEKVLSYGITIFQISCFLIFGITQINPESFLSILGVFIEPFINFILPAIATIMFLRKRVYFLSSAIVLIVLTIGISGVSISSMISQHLTSSNATTQAFNITE
ncbi:hypothetical protein H311_00220, partial [Anncaliia algerae PRA109]